MNEVSIAQVVACLLFNTNLLPGPTLTYCQLNPYEHTSVKFKSKYKSFNSWKCIWDCCLWNGSHFFQGGVGGCANNLAMTWTCPDAHTSEQGGAQGFHSWGDQHELNRKILLELLPSIDEYNEWSLCAVVTFSSHTSWILGAKTSWKSVHCKVNFTHILWPKNIKFFCLRSTYVVASVFNFYTLRKISMYAIRYWMKIDYNWSFLAQF